MLIDQLLTSIEHPPVPSLQNLHWLLISLNKWEDLYGKPFKVNSGYRSFNDQKRIYADKNAARLIRGMPELPVPLHSQHMNGNAVDLSDHDRAIEKWVVLNLPFFEKEGLYFERFDYTHGMDGNWVHAQRIAPKSRNRFFIP